MQASSRFDWGIGAPRRRGSSPGFYLDLWAHAHGMVDDSFLTPVARRSCMPAPRPTA